MLNLTELFLVLFHMLPGLQYVNVLLGPFLVSEFGNVLERNRLVLGTWGKVGLMLGLEERVKQKRLLRRSLRLGEVIVYFLHILRTDVPIHIDLDFLVHLLRLWLVI